MNPGDHVTPHVKLLSKLGSGAMGSVWMAEDELLGRLVAVKLMMPQLVENAELRQRFEQEARVLARFASPHVVSVFGYGVTDSGVPYILMELLDGETLRARLQRLGPLPPADVVRIVTQVASALGRAHELGIVHRDLKPENLFLIHVGGELFVKVLDFGIAKQPAVDPLKALTMTGQLIGTPFYMSPEQLVSGKHVDHRTDVWSLAAVAYEALTARRPFQGQSFGEQILVVHAGDFTKPSVLQPGLPETIDAWAERALQKDPDARFGSVRELADAFEGAVRAAALAATAPSTPRAEAVVKPAPARPEPAPPPPRPQPRPASSKDEHQAVPTLLSGDREIVAPELQVGAGRVRLLLGNILRAGTDAIVNPTDSSLSGAGPLDAAIRAAAGPDVEEELRRVGTCDVGGAVLTGPGRILPPIRFIVHAVGPGYSVRSDEECAALLRRAHTESLRLAEEKGLWSVAFPALGAGGGYPLGKAASIAFSAAVDHLAERARSVQLIVFVLTSPAELMAFTAAFGASAARLPPRPRD